MRGILLWIIAVLLICLGLSVIISTIVYALPVLIASWAFVIFGFGGVVALSIGIGILQHLYT